MGSWPNDDGFDTEYEQTSPVELNVKGDIPAYAAGVLYRTGPLGYKVETSKGKTWHAGHWFDGLSAVHRFQIDAPQNGSVQVTYRSRRIVDELIENIRKTGTRDGITFGAKRDPCKSIFNKVMTSFSQGRAIPNVGVTLSVNMPGLSPIDSETSSGTSRNSSEINSEAPGLSNGHSSGIKTLHTKTDANPFCKVDPETLEPLGIAHQSDLHPDLKGPLSSAHAKSDPETGDIYNFNAEFGAQCTYRIFCTSASTGKTSILATFSGTPCYIHSLFLTESYVVLCVWNSHFTNHGISILYNKSVTESIAPFDSSKPAKWYVIDRRHGKGLVSTFDSEPFFCFHTVNAWEAPSPTDPSKTDILAELHMYDNLDVIHHFYYENILSSKYNWNKSTDCVGYFARFRLPNVGDGELNERPGKAEAVYKADKAISGELPTINPSYLTKPHRYTYGVIDRLKSSFMDGIVKFDSETQTSIIWEEDGHTPGEAIFVGNPKGEKEDDGVLLTVVLNGHKGESYLLVLDARDLKEMGRAEVKGPVTFGFHGAHVPGGRRYGGDI
ncbi:carotenoid oxygenase [Delitschia confertaspora ATCC 74209]|uniref:Carotenoid oxygenase n=1 Tax=Delitschia confertaspora ATCC 74209 TaxID=1513339 RepID=A0A9P4JYL3_9PLEO|nr:carotenoid oxygenase [Delitschia confertaspora ATCC 74209]